MKKKAFIASSTLLFGFSEPEFKVHSVDCKRREREREKALQLLLTALISIYRLDLFTNRRESALLRLPVFKWEK